MWCINPNDSRTFSEKYHPSHKVQRSNNCNGSTNKSHSTIAVDAIARQKTKPKTAQQFVYSITRHSLCALLHKYFIFVNYNGPSNPARNSDELWTWPVSQAICIERVEVAIWRSFLVGLIKITRTPFWWRNESAVEMGDGRKISTRKWRSWEF